MGDVVRGTDGVFTRRFFTATLQVSTDGHQALLTFPDGSISDFFHSREEAFRFIDMAWELGLVCVNDVSFLRSEVGRSVLVTTLALNPIFQDIPANRVDRRTPEARIYALAHQL
ncbi:MAG: hypothetical protein WC757_03990 [Candidatus Paceibacterota bacterium]